MTAAAMHPYILCNKGYLKQQRRSSILSTATGNSWPKVRTERTLAPGWKLTAMAGFKGKLRNYSSYSIKLLKCCSFFCYYQSTLRLQDVHILGAFAWRGLVLEWGKKTQGRKHSTTFWVAASSPQVFYCGEVQVFRSFVTPILQSH